MAVIALTLGSRLLLMGAVCMGLMLALALASLIPALFTLRLSSSQSGERVRRGEKIRLTVYFSFKGILPIGSAAYQADAGVSARFGGAPFCRYERQCALAAAHVGVFTAGLRACTVEDLFGVASRRVPLRDTSFTLTVLPQTFPTDPLVLSPGDPGSEIMARATEDLNAPSDVRSYQPGDAMKKIHWKLSLRKGELIVRKYDEPILQDVLILMDCSRPPSWGHPQAEADLRDALLETAASVLADQFGTDHQIRLPLLGGHPVDVVRSMGLPNALDYLARVDFSETDRFERVLRMESRHLRKVGCVVVASARLNIPMVDIMIRMHRFGPNLRFYLVTFAPDDENVLPLISRMKQAGLEVSYVTPEPSDSPSSSPE